MDAQLELRRLMIRELERIQRKNPRYSLRSFARQLGLVPSCVSEIMAAKRRITAPVAARILANIDLESRSQAEFFPASLIEACRKPSSGAFSKKTEYLQLNMDHFQVISDWVCYAVLSLIETDDFSSDVGWIARRLGVSAQRVRCSLARLKRVGLIQVERGRISKAQANPLTTSQDISSLAIRRAHRQNLEVAQEALDKVAVDQRDFSMITMAIDPKLLPRAKERIRKFRRELCMFLESGSKREVYRMSIQIFPLSRGEGVRK